MTPSPPQAATPSPVPPAPPPTFYSSRSDREVHLLDRLSVLYKYRKPAAGVFLAVIAWVMAGSYTTQPVYQARVRLLIEDETPGMGTPAEIAQNFAVPDPEVYLNTQFRILEGRQLGTRVVTRLGLHEVPEYNGQGPQPTPLAMAITSVKRFAMRPVRAVFGGGKETVQPPAAPLTDPSGYVDAFISHVHVQSVRGSRLVDVAFTAADREFAQRAANAIAEEYVAQNLELKVQTLDKSLEWLAAEVARQRSQVEQSERALAEYRERKDAGALADNQNIIIARLNQLNNEVTRARTERFQKEAIWKQVQEAGKNQDALGIIIQSPLVQSLRSSLSDLQRERVQLLERYGEKHPDVQKVNAQIADAQRQYDAQIEKAVQNARAEYEAALAEERSLTEDLQRQQGAATELNRKNIDYTVLQRSAESNQELYNSLLTREKELRVIANSRANNVRLVDRAQLGVLIAPNHRRDWIYALFFATLLALGVAFAADYLDDTIKTPEDVTRRLKLQFLGLVPAIRGDQHPLLTGAVPHDFGEAFRALRTALVGRAADAGPHIIAVTSAQPLEGKTTAAVNMAMALAIGGSRVLLIDADMRRPSVHKALRLSNECGLSQLLGAQARMREVVQRTHDPNLLVISAGRAPSNPSELLSSDRMRALMAGLESGPFDWVVIDTPPVLAVTDAVIVVPLVEVVSFVIGAEMTRWRLAERAVETILSANPRAIAAVLNRVDFARNKYYYSRYYGHQYKSYYREIPAA